jgi:hypothetical protein
VVVVEVDMSSKEEPKQRGLKSEDLYYKEVMEKIAPEIGLLEEVGNSAASQKVIIQVQTGIAALKLKAAKMAHDMFISQVRVMLGGEK